MDHKRGFDSQRSVNRRDGSAAPDYGHLRHRHEEVIRHAANENEQRARDPKEPSGVRNLQRLQLMHIFGKLKITSSGAVPFRQRHILEITRLDQAGLRFEEAAFGDTVLELGGKTAPEVLLNRGRRLFGIVPAGGERFVALGDSSQIVVKASGLLPAAAFYFF